MWKAVRRLWTSNSDCVRFSMGHVRRNNKSTSWRDWFTSHSTRTTENRRMCVQSCHIRKACSRHASSHRAVGLACTAIHITLLLRKLLITTIIWYLNCVFIILRNIPWCSYRYKMIEIHTQRDGMWVTQAPNICYNNCNYGNSNIIFCSQVSVRIIYYLRITKKCNNVHGFAEITNARKRGRSVWMR